MVGETTGLGEGKKNTFTYDGLLHLPFLTIDRSIKMPGENNRVTQGYREIRLNKATDPNRLELEIIITSPTGEQTIQNQALLLNEQNQFDWIGSALNPALVLKPQESGNALFNIPGTEDVVELQANGNITLGEMTNSNTYAIKTFADIETVGPIDIQEIKLCAKNIYLNHSVLAKDKISLNVEGELKNIQSVVAKIIKVTGSGLFKNEGLASASDKLSVKIPVVKNTGTLGGKEVKIYTNSESLPPLPAARSTKTYLKNKGIIFAEEDLKVKGRMVNEREGTIVSSQNASFEHGKVKNEGKLTVSDFLKINTVAPVDNSGKIWLVKGSAEIFSKSAIENSGDINTSKELKVKSSKDLINHLTGVFRAGTELSVHGHSFQNAGLMEANDSVQVSSEAKTGLVNTETGKIHCNGKISIQGMRKIRNKGNIVGKEIVDAQTLGKILNAYHAEVSGSSVHVWAGKKVKNGGDILAEISLLLASRELQNLQQGRLVSEGEAHITADSVSNQGLMAANTNLQITAKVLVNQIATGELRSLQELTLTVQKKLENSHLIQAKKLTIVSQGDVHNKAQGVIAAEGEIKIQAETLQNDGLITAHKCFLEIIRKLSNSDTARIIAEQQLELLSKMGDMENLGEVSSKGSLLLQGVKKLLNGLEAHIKAEQWMQLVKCGSIENFGSVIARGNLLIEAINEFVNQAKGVVEAENITVTANTVQNLGILDAQKNLKVEARSIFNNLLTGLILAGEKAELFSKHHLENSGTIESRGTLLLKSEQILKNLKDGTIVSEQDFEMMAGYILSNAGTLTSNSDMLLETTHHFANALGADIKAAGKLAVTARMLENQGQMTGASVTLNILEHLQNYQSGQIQAEEALSLIAKNLDNEGLLGSNKTLSAEVTLILHNHKEGKITAKDAIQLSSASILRNAGTIQGLKDVTVKAEKLLETLLESAMTAGGRLEAISQFALEHSGIIEGEQILLKAKQVFNLAAGSEVHAASGGLEVDAREALVKNAGILKSDGTLSFRAETLHNLSSGKITAEEALSIFAKGIAENDGLLKGKTIKVEAKSFVNRGEILSLKTISLTVEQHFKHCKEGKLSAEETITVLAKDLQLMGQMMAKGDFVANLRGEFEYATESLWAAGLLRLMLSKGYDFNQPLKTPGSLSIESPGDVRFSNTVSVGKSMDATAQNITVVEKGIFADEGVSLSASGPTGTIQIGKAVSKNGQQVSDGAYVASNGNISIKAATIKNSLGEIYTLKDLLLEALQLVENSGNIQAAGSAKIIAPLFTHKILTTSNGSSASVISAKPTMTVSGDCTLQCNSEILGGVLHAGGNLNIKGEFSSLSFEAFSAWYEVIKVRGKRKSFGRGHKFHDQVISRKTTHAIYDSEISAGKRADINGKRFTSQGAFRAGDIKAEFEQLKIGNNLLSTGSSTQENIPLEPFFEENALFGKTQDDFYVYNAKLPIRNDFNLAPPVYIGDENPVAKALFSPLIEKDLVQKALHTLIRSGFIGAGVTSPETILAQLRGNRDELKDGFNQHFLDTALQGRFKIDNVDGDGNCLFEACLRQLKVTFSKQLNHPIHSVVDHKALRVLITSDLESQCTNIKELVRSIIMSGSPLDLLPQGSFRNLVGINKKRYERRLANFDEQVANLSVQRFLDRAPSLYIADMKKVGVWGGDIELGRIAERYGVNFQIHKTKATDAGYQEECIVPIGNNPERPYVDLMYTGNHYNALKPTSQNSITKSDVKLSKIDLSATSPEAILTQLRANADELLKMRFFNVSADERFRVDTVTPDGNCIFEACLRQLKTVFSNQPTHPIHSVPNNKALREIIAKDLETQRARIKELIQSILTNASPSCLPDGQLRDLVRTNKRLIEKRFTPSDEVIATARIEKFLEGISNLYLSDMKLDGSVGGEIELGCISERYQVDIQVHQLKVNDEGYHREGTKPITIKYKRAENTPALSTIDLMLSSKHYYNALQACPPSSQASRLTVTDLALSKKALIYYQQGLYNGDLRLTPFLHFPKELRNQIAMGSPGQAVLRATTITLDGKPGSILDNSGRIQADKGLLANADRILNQQRTQTNHSLMRKRHRTKEYVPTTSAIPDTGVMSGDSLKGKANRLTSIGGEIHSGSGGTWLEIRDEALFKALTTSQAVQGKVKRKGTGYQIEPVFAAADITSKGDQTIIVTHGTFTAEGMRSKADGKNTITAEKEVRMSNAYAKYNLASPSSSKQKQGGTSFASLPSEAQGVQGVEITSKQSSVTLINTHLISDGDVTLKAKTVVALLNSIGETSAYSRKKQVRGFQATFQNVKQSKTHVQSTQFSILGNLIIKAEDEVNIRAVNGLVAGDVSIQALNVIIEGAIEKQKSTTKTLSFEVGFFGSSAMAAMLQGQGRQVLNHLLNEDSFVRALKQLSSAKDTGGKTVAAAQTFVEGWRVAVLAARGCQGDNLAGEMTDRWGITTPVRDAAGQIQGRMISPSVKFSFSTSTSVTTETRTIPSTLMIGGDLHIVGDIIKLKDGTRLEARNITLQAKKLLEIHAAQHTYKNHYSQKGGSVSVSMNGGFGGAGANGAKGFTEEVHYQNAMIKANGLLSILVDEGKVNIQGGELQGRDVLVRTTELIIASLQDTSKSKHTSFSVSVDGSGMPSGGSFGHSSSKSAEVKRPSVIHAINSLEVFTDYLLQKGSVLSADGRAKVRGLTQENLRHWEFEDIRDKSSHHGREVSLSYRPNDSFPVTGFFLSRDAKKVSVTHATVAALDLVGEIPAGINRSRNRTKEVLTDKHSSVGIPILMPNISQLKEDVALFKQAIQLPEAKPNLQEKEIGPAKEKIALTPSSKKNNDKKSKAVSTKKSPEKSAYRKKILELLRDTISNYRKTGSLLPLDKTEEALESHPLLKGTGRTIRRNLVNIGKAGSKKGLSPKEAAGTGLGILFRSVVNKLASLKQTDPSERIPLVTPSAKPVTVRQGFNKNGTSYLADAATGQRSKPAFERISETGKPFSAGSNLTQTLFERYYGISKEHYRMSLNKNINIGATSFGFLGSSVKREATNFRGKANVNVGAGINILKACFMDGKTQIDVNLLSGHLSAEAAVGTKFGKGLSAKTLLVKSLQSSFDTLPLPTGTKTAVELAGSFLAIPLGNELVGSLSIGGSVLSAKLTTNANVSVMTHNMKATLEIDLYGGGFQYKRGAGWTPYKNKTGGSLFFQHGYSTPLVGGGIKLECEVVPNDQKQEMPSRITPK